MKWPILLLALWSVQSWSVLHVDQGLYEDVNYVHAFQDAPRPPILTRRGLASVSIWYQLQHGLTPALMRMWNLRLAAFVSLLVGLLAVQFGLSGWIAGGVMLLHPLTVETLAQIAGRYELIAAIGVLLGCLAATWASMWRWPLMLMACVLGVMGKETAAIGLPLMLLTDVLLHPSRIAWASVGAAVLLIIGVCLWQQHSGESSTAAVAAWPWVLRQSAATFRLLCLSIMPIGQTIDYDYDHLSAWWCGLAMCSLCMLATFAMSIWHRWPMIAFALMWALLVALPRLIVHTPKSYFNEHQWYLALPAVAWGVASVYQSLSLSYMQRRVYAV